MTSSPLLEVHNLQVSFPRRRTLLRREDVRAVDGVSFDIRPGETVGLVGESGSGKSTIGNAILGLVEPHAGSISFEGSPVLRRTRADRQAYRANVQAIFQDPVSSLNPLMRVSTILEEPLKWLRQMTDPRERDREVCRLLEAVELPSEVRHRQPRALSGGQRQRIGIARALAPRPRLIICDEAVSSLDVSTQATVVNLLADLQDREGIAYLFISHDLSVVRQISHRVGVLYRGWLAEWGDANRVHDAPCHPYTETLLAAVPVPDPEVQAQRRARRRTLRSAASPTAFDGGCPFAHRCGYVHDRCGDRPPLFRVREHDLASCHLHANDGALAGRPVADATHPRLG